LKAILLAAALLLPATLAFAQDAEPEPEQAPAAAPKPAVRAAKPAPKAVPKPAAAAIKPGERPTSLNIVQIVGIKQIDPTTYELDAKLVDGSSIDLRMNAFVMQDLGRRLGTFGR
jgi:3-oxoacyl-ACP reductase-like protein